MYYSTLEHNLDTVHTGTLLPYIVWLQQEAMKQIALWQYSGLEYTMHRQILPVIYLWCMYVGSHDIIMVYIHNGLA